MSKIITNQTLFKNASSTMQIIKQLPYKKRLKHLKELQTKLKQNPIVCQDSYGKVDDFLQYKFNFLRQSNPKIYLDEKESDEILQEKLNQLEENVEYNIVQQKLSEILETSYSDKEQNIVELNIPDKSPKDKTDEEKLEDDIIAKYEKKIKKGNNYNLSEKEFKSSTEKTIDKSGIYKWVDGKLIESQHEPRFQTEHTNWDAGNADPEDLQKHKELLDRQYFSGPVWESRSKPTKCEDDVEALLLDYAEMEGETNPNEITPEQIKEEGGLEDETVKEGEWKSVRR